MEAAAGVVHIDAAAALAAGEGAYAPAGADWSPTVDAAVDRECAWTGVLKPLGIVCACLSSTVAYDCLPNESLAAKLSAWWLFARARTGAANDGARSGKDAAAGVASKFGIGCSYPAAVICASRAFKRAAASAIPARATHSTAQRR
jgi:hypothetical protein